jgi:hypothetical protein
MWSFTAYPSEPFLSHVAGHLLHDEPSDLVNALRCLQNKLEGGMISKGANGEMVSRLLLQLCKDLVAKDLYPTQYTTPVEHTQVPSSSYPVFQGQVTSAFDQPLLYCRDIPVIIFLEKLFGQNAWPTESTQKEAARMAFQDAYINFSHWVAMSEHIASNEDQPKCEIFCVVKYFADSMLSYYSPGEWTFRHWSRTSAVQCCHLQPSIDKVIPVFFKNNNQPPYLSVSHILISDKLRNSPSATDVSQITRTHEAISLHTEQPWIAITLDLGISDTRFKSTFPTRSNHGDLDNQCLRIYATGMSSRTFPFLGGINGLEKVMEGITARQKIPQFDDQLRIQLQDQFKFGATSSHAHMKWEEGRRP